MKKCIAIFFLLFLFLQAIPMLHFFAAEKSVFYACVDEDRADEAKLKIKKEAKEYLSYSSPCFRTAPQLTHGTSQNVSLTPSPSLEFMAPPPDFTC